MRRRAVFLDRDGVINRAIVRDRKPYPPRDLDELEILPGAREALTHLRSAGYMLIVVTNQPDVARGTARATTVNAINRCLEQTLPIDSFRTCFHDDKDRCNCRKPQPGLLLAAGKDFGIELSRSFMIGDRWRDIDAGKAAGCTTVWIDCDYDEQRPVADYRVQSLAEAAELILSLTESPTTNAHTEAHSK